MGRHIACGILIRMSKGKNPLYVGTGATMVLKMILKK